MKDIAQYVRTFYTHEAKCRAYIYILYIHIKISIFIYIYKYIYILKRIQSCADKRTFSGAKDLSDRSKHNHFLVLRRCDIAVMQYCSFAAILSFCQRKGMICLDKGIYLCMTVKV